jgi:hypothetical protein
MPCGEQDPESLPLQVLRRVMVSLMMNTTIRTMPLAIRQREVLIDIPALRTQFTAGEELPNKYHVAIVPAPFVIARSKQHPPRCIQNTLRQLGFRKATSVQRFKTEREIIGDQRETLFVHEVRTFVSYILMDFRYFDRRKPGSQPRSRE